MTIFPCHAGRVGKCKNEHPGSARQQIKPRDARDARVQDAGPLWCLRQNYLAHVTLTRRYSIHPTAHPEGRTFTPSVPSVPKKNEHNPIAILIEIYWYPKAVCVSCFTAAGSPGMALFSPYNSPLGAGVCLLHTLDVGVPHRGLERL